MADQFNSFADMAGQVAPEAWETEIRGGDDRWVIIAPHGGTIEPGSDDIAVAIAGGDLALYLFRSKVKKAEANLHITSRRFDDPEALELLSMCDVAIAIHGAADTREGDTVTLMGGLNNAVRDRISTSLAAADFPSRIAEGGLAGRNQDNICNRCRSGRGVQLELPRHLRRRLGEDQAALARYAGAIRDALGV
jgi:phage replication-related protein YjqB (UPF0714/DUF867 family)